MLMLMCFLGPSLRGIGISGIPGEAGGGLHGQRHFSSPDLWFILEGAGDLVSRL